MTQIDDKLNETMERLAVQMERNAQLRAEVYTYRCAMQRLLDPEDLGWAVTEEVRDIVRGALHGWRM